MRKLYSKVYSICENLVLKFKQSQAIQGIWKILVSFRPSAPIKKGTSTVSFFIGYMSKTPLVASTIFIPYIR